MGEGQPHDAELDLEAPNESAPGHHPSRPDVADAERPHDAELDVEAPNESATGHHPAERE
jgi:hypothetical protein